jgi:hypothetical protein
MKYKGYTYIVYIRPWKKKVGRHEVIKYPNGYRNLWERIPYKEYLEVLKLKNEQN